MKNALDWFRLEVLLPRNRLMIQYYRILHPRIMLEIQLLVKYDPKTLKD